MSEAGEFVEELPPAAEPAPDTFKVDVYAVHLDVQGTLAKDLELILQPHNTITLIKTYPLEVHQVRHDDSVVIEHPETGEMNEYPIMVLCMYTFGKVWKCNLFGTWAPVPGHPDTEVCRDAAPLTYAARKHVEANERRKAGYQYGGLVHERTGPRNRITLGMQQRMDLGMARLLAFGPERPHPKASVHHRDGNPFNDDFENLEWKLPNV